MAQVSEGFKFERVAGGIEKEHRRLLAGFAGKARVGFDFEALAGGAQAVRKRGEGVWRQHRAEVRNGHQIAIDRIAPRDAAAAGHLVDDELVAEEIKIDPSVG